MRKTLEITFTVSPCLSCHFCPQEKLAKAYTSERRKLSLDDFKIILDKLPSDVEIHASGFSEGFLHPQAAEMLFLASRKGHKIHIYSTLMGLTREHCGWLLETAIEYFRVHVPDQKGLRLPDNIWIRQHEMFRELAIAATYMSMGEPTPAVKCHLAALSIPVELPEMLSRGGNLWDRKPHTGSMRCSMERWHSNVCLPNGEVWGCCQDYSGTVRLGNLLEQSYDEVFENAEKWRANMEAKAQGICSVCEWMQPAPA